MGKRSSEYTPARCRATLKSRGWQHGASEPTWSGKATSLASRDSFCPAGPRANFRLYHSFV
eukprot:1312433-Pyramimonas_sp.AAC.1